MLTGVKHRPCETKDGVGTCWETIGPLELKDDAIKCTLICALREGILSKSGQPMPHEGRCNDLPIELRH